MNIYAVLLKKYPKMRLKINILIDIICYLGKIIMIIAIMNSEYG